MKLNNTTKYEYDYLDIITGEGVNYLQVTKWSDGTTMSDALCDGVVYRKIDELYYKRVNSDIVNVLTLGLKNDGVTRNEAVFENAKSKLPKNTTFFFPAGTYLFGALPSKYNTFNTPLAISITDKGGNLIGESVDNTFLQFLPGCVGIQITGGLTPSVIDIKDLSIQGPGAESALEGRVINNGPTRPDGGQNADVGRPIGSSSLEFGNYRFNGINGWGQFNINNVNIANFSGHGLCIFGDPNVYGPLPSFEVTGTINPIPNGTPGFIFTANNPSTLTKRFQNTAITIAGQVYRCNADKDGELFCIEVRPTYPTPGVYTLSVAITGGALIADNSQIAGICNFDYNGGCGVFIVGADANQTNVINLSLRENGLWGVYDNSFLGTHFFGVHGTGNGRRVNTLNVNNVFGVNDFKVGAFATPNSNARSTYVGCYSEEGNQGPSFFGPKTTVLGGIHAAGAEGPGLYLQGNVVNTITTPQISIGTNTLEFFPYKQTLVYVSGVIELRNTTELWFIPTSSTDYNNLAVGMGLNVNATAGVITSKANGAVRYATLSNFVQTSGSVVAFYAVANPSPQTKPLRFTELQKGGWGFAYDLTENEAIRLSFAETQQTLKGRTISIPGVYMPTQYVGDSLKTEVYLLTDYINNRQFRETTRPGDEINVRLSNGGPSKYMCVDGGTAGTLTTSATVSGSGNNISLSTPIPELRAGDFVSINGRTHEITGGNGPLGVYLSPNVSNVNNAAISYANPTFIPIGFGKGPLNNRPDNLGIHDRGWQWLADDNTKTMWTGTTWI